VKINKPKIGMVIRYSFLWGHEKQRGAIEGSKDRPCAIVVAAPVDEFGNVNVILAPITHSPPKDKEDSIILPPNVCKALGLDDKENWLRIDELNRFAWPGFDLRAIPNQETYEYGMLPQEIFEKLKAKIVERNKAKKVQVFKRD
jgi:hypothetical protein